MLRAAELLNECRLTRAYLVIQARRLRDDPHSQGKASKTANNATTKADRPSQNGVPKSSVIRLVN